MEERRIEIDECFLIKDIKDIVLHICAKFDNEQAKDTGVIDKIKLVILQTN